MSESFSVGEIALAWNPSAPNERFHGEECEIIALPQLHEYLSPITGLWITAGRYLVNCLGDHYQCPPHRLRKKRPPPQREATSTWDDLIVWCPKAVEHV